MICICFFFCCFLVCYWLFLLGVSVQLLSSIVDKDIAWSRKVPELWRLIRPPNTMSNNDWAKIKIIDFCYCFGLNNSSTTSLLRLQAGMRIFKNNKSTKSDTDMNFDWVLIHLKITYVWQCAIDLWIWRWNQLVSSAIVQAIYANG